MPVLRGEGYCFMMRLSSSIIMPCTRRLLSSVASRSAMSLSRVSVSLMRLRMYSRFMFLSFISATYSACTLSMPKPSIRLGTTSLSRSVLRIIAIALSMSSRILPRPFSRCSFSRLRLRSKYMRRLTHSVRHDVHSPSISPTPMTRGVPSMRMLKLQANESMSGVALNSLAMSLSGSAPRLRSMASLRPPRTVSSRMSFISFALPALTSSATLSMMLSTVAV